MKIPFLKNFRRGFATNSSSSHSFVYLKEDADQPGATPTGYMRNEFGWDDFRLDTIREKLFYVLVGRIGGGWGSSNDASEEFEQLGDQFPELTEDDFNAAKSGYIDHESVGTISAAEARDPRVAIFGGNDNDGASDERADAVRAKEIDWARTGMSYEDLPHIQIDDEEGQNAAKAFIEDNPWAARY